MDQELLFPVESFNSAVDIFRRNLADVFQCRNQIFDFAVNVCDFLLMLFDDIVFPFFPCQMVGFRFLDEPCLHLRFDLPNSMGLLYVTALMEIFSRADEVGDAPIFGTGKPDGKSITTMTAFHKPSEPGMFSFAGVFYLPIFGQLFLTIEKCIAIHDAIMVPDGKEVIGYIFIFPLAGIPFAHKDTAMGCLLYTSPSPRD